MADVKAQTRTDRLKAALRENLKRRKAQARGRGASSDRGAPTQEPPEPAPGETLPDRDQAE